MLRKAGMVESNAATLCTLPNGRFAARSAFSLPHQIYGACKENFPSDSAHVSSPSTYSSGMTMLRRLAWSSVPSPSFSVARLNEIVSRSRRNNERNHVSGTLVFTGTNFLAILEGEGADLDHLWRRLEDDERHRDLLRIGYDLCGRRMFPEWMMGYLVDPEVDAQIATLRSLHAPIVSNRSGAGVQGGTACTPPPWSPPPWAPLMGSIMLRADCM